MIGRAVVARRDVPVVALMLCALVGVLALGVSSASAESVRIFKSAPFSQPGSLQRSSGDAIDQETGNVYVVEDNADAVDIFGAKGGAPVGGVPAQITGLNFFESEPEGVAVDNACYYHHLSGAPCEGFDPSNGDVYITEGPEGVIGKYKLNALSDEYELAGTLSISGPGGVAVDTDGNVYVANRGEEGISEFDSSGVEVGKIAQATVEDPSYVGVGAPGVVYVGGYEASGVAKVVVNAKDEVEHEELLAPESGAVAVDSAGDAYVFAGGFSDNGRGHIAVFGPSGSLDEEFGFSELAYVEGVAVNEKSKDADVSNYLNFNEGDLEVFGSPLPPPSVTIKPVTPIAQNSATFNGEVDPNEVETTYHFEYSTDGVSWTALEDISAGEGTSEVPVTQTATGLTGNTAYRVRLAAVNSEGSESISGEEPFSTLVGPVHVSQTAATDLSATEATLHATIQPENQPSATYRFEYGSTSAYGTTVPAGEGHVGGTPTPVSQAITGLMPDKTYHFRVVASNGVGSPTTTADQTFTTYSSTQTSSVCPNEQVRKESDVNPETGVPFSLQLPECRAYEKVSPLLKNGGPITAAVQVGIASGSEVSRVGAEGSTVLIKSTGIWPGGEQPVNNDELSSGGSEGEQYRVTRGVSGWGFKPEVPNLRVFMSSILPNSADMGLNGIWNGAGFAPIEADIEQGSALKTVPNFYLLGPGGAVAEIGPSVPLSDRGAADEGSGEVSSVGASTDLSHMLFVLGDFRWPSDTTELTDGPNPIYTISSLYEYFGTGHSGEEGDGPTLVGVDNTGALISQCGTEAGGYEGGGSRSSEADEPEARSISGGGSTVFFTADAAGAKCDESSSTGEGTGPAVSQVFARIGEPGTENVVGHAVTVNVAASSECSTGAFDSCNVTSAVRYQGSSTDGSKVFFTSEQPLVAGDTDPTNNLYECRLPGDSGAPLIRMTPVNPCPNLVRVSVPVSGAGAKVQSVAAVSADGSHVYFIAKGVLGGENAEHNSPMPGEDNLYVWQEPSPGYPQGGTAFIATLPSAACKLGEVQATPDGEQLVFTSSADLTPDDTSTVSQVFLYEAQREALIRVSEGQDGFNDDGNTTTNPASINNGAYSEGRRVISEDGSTVVFESSQALTAQVHGGTDNVYLWRGGNVYLISDGTPAGEQAGLGKAGLVGIDASGQNVFFTTEAQLVGQDSDELSDLYDARIGGGFPAPKVNECIGEACQGASPVPLAPAMPGSLSPRGVGNFTPPTVKPASPPKPKSLTRAEKLAKAVKLCEKDKSKKKYTKCEAAAHKRYRANAKPKTRSKRRTRTSAGTGGKR